MDAVFHQLLTEAVNVVQLSANAAGDLAEVGRTDGVPASWQATRKRVWTGQDKYTNAQAVVFLDPEDVTIDGAAPDWRIEYGGETFEVLEVAAVRDHAAGTLHHYEVAVR